MSVSSNPNWMPEATKCYQEGGSDVEVCRIMRITKAAFKDFYQTNGSFKDFVDMGRVLAECWWMEQGRGALRDKTFNIRLWELHMQNEYGWVQQKTESRDTTGEDLTPQQLREKIAPMLGKLVKHMEGEGTTDAQVLTLLNARERANN